MISLCTVVVDLLEKEILDIFLESITNKSLFVSEIIVVKVDAEESKVENTKFGAINLKRIYYPIEEEKLDEVATRGGIEHALGLHKALEYTEYPYVWFSDPDVFMYSALDSFYLETFNDYNLNLIGLSHYDPTSHAAQFFCNPLNLFFYKSDWPPDDFLEGKLFIRNSYYEDEIVDNLARLDGKFLIPGKINSFKEQFIYPDGRYETGCNLYLYAKKNNWKWLSFQTDDCHRYTTKYYKGNVKFNSVRPYKPLLYHAVSAVSFEESRKNFTKAYQESI